MQLADRLLDCVLSVSERRLSLDRGMVQQRHLCVGREDVLHDPW